MENEALHILHESLFVSVIMMLKVLLLIVTVLTLTGFVIYLVGIVWFCREEARNQRKPVAPTIKRFLTILTINGGTMKQKFLRTFSLFAFLLLGAFATAQAQPINSFTAEIPFAFTVNNQEFPAGQYLIRLRENDSVTHLRLLTADKKKVLTIFSILKETPMYVENTKLIFRRYGNRYFLGEIWARGEAVGHEIWRSEAEKQLRQQIRNEQIPVRVTPTNRTEIRAVPPSQ